jgi:hypothetical protein
MRRSDLARYGLWCGVVVTAEGNRRAYHMTTTWLPHLAANTLSLWLPEIVELLRREADERPGPPARSPARELLGLCAGTLTAVLSRRREYALYVAPLALGYVLSNPWMNIYKGELAELKLAGFGLDALPHASTAFALTGLVRDTAEAAGELAAEQPALADWGRALVRHQVGLSALALALATLVWELGEHRIYRHELALRGSPERTNMQWSVSDTAYDCAANLIGWLLATAVRGV